MTRSQRTTILLIAGLIAAFTAISVKNRLSQAPEVAVAAPTKRVLVAKRELAAGSFIQPASDLEWGNGPIIPEGAQEPEPLLHEGVARPEDFANAIVRKNLHVGDPIPAEALVKAGGGGLMSAVLDPNMRAVSISVTATSGNAGFVLPGDFVDLILTREVTRNISNGRESETRKMIYSKSFAENVRVLAVDQNLDNPDSKAMLAKTITVEVTPTQAQMIAVATELGKISLSLRSVAGGSEAATGTAAQGVSDTDVSSEDASADVSRQVKMLRPKETQNLEFYRGQGRVSESTISHDPEETETPRRKPAR